MAKTRFNASFTNHIDSQLKIQLSLYEFFEEEIFYVYCPALDLYGYGKNEIEARDSFNITLEEFLKYTTNKKTLDKELKRLGWKISKSKSKPSYTVPEIEKLLVDNEDFHDLLNFKDYKKTSQTIEIPTIA